MSTHCRVGRVVFPPKDVIGTPRSPGVLVFSIYCHFDGDSVGEVLKLHYTDEERVRQLIDGGDVSLIDAAGWEPYDPEGQPHTQDFANFGNDVLEGPYFYLFVPGYGWLQKGEEVTANGNPKWEAF